MSDPHPHADIGEALSAHVRAEIDHWLTKFPVDRKRSAVIAALHAVQHEKGHLPVEEGQEQGPDMRAVDVGVSHQHDSMVAQLRQV